MLNISYKILKYLHAISIISLIYIPAGECLQTQYGRKGHQSQNAKFLHIA
jgi:hypothetical protein